MGILAISTVGVVYLVSSGNQTSQDRSRLASSNSCVALANGLLNRVKGTGLAMSSTPYFPTTYDADGTRHPGGAGLLNSGINAADRWPNGAPFDILTFDNSDANPDNWFTVTKPALLINGVMNDLLAIYNSSPANFCTNAAGADYNNMMNMAQYYANSADGIDPELFAFDQTDDGALAGSTAGNNIPDVIEAGGLTASLRIQPYNIDDLVVLGACPAAPLQLAPASAVPNESATAQMAQTGGVRNDLGLLTTVTVNYTDRNGTAKSCFVQQRFQYDKEVNNFPRITGTLEIEPTVDPNNRIGGTGPPTGIPNGGRLALRCDEPDLQYELRHTLTPQKEGSVFLCRNRTRRRGAPPGGAIQTVVQGYWTDAFFRDTSDTTETTGEASTAGTSYFAGGAYFVGSPDGVATVNCTGGDSNGSGTPCNTNFIFPPPGTPAFTFNQANPDPAPRSLFANREALVQSIRELDYNDAPAGGGATEHWVPCAMIDNLNDVTATDSAGLACDIPVTHTFAGGQYTIQLDVDTATDYACDIMLDIAEVDAAYNISSADAANFYTLEDYVEQKAPGDAICFNNTAGVVNGATAGNFYFICGGACP